MVDNAERPVLRVRRTYSSVMLAMLTILSLLPCEARPLAAPSDVNIPY